MSFAETTLALLVFASPAAASSLRTLFTFTGTGQQGFTPSGQILRDPSGNLFGIATNSTAGNGAVYELSPRSGGHHYQYVSLYQFTVGKVGVAPAGGLAVGPTGAFFGATDANFDRENTGCGSVFTLSTGGTAMSISHLNRGDWGCYPNGPVNVATTGDVFGIFQDGAGDFGGIMRFLPPSAHHTRWSQQVIYSFTGQADGFYPLQPMMLSRSGALFGSALASSNGQVFPTPLFRLGPPARGSKTWNFSLAYQFVPSECADGIGQLTEGKDGVIYGPCGMATGGNTLGNIFTLTPPATSQTGWTRNVLWQFGGGRDGGHPLTAVTLDAAGNVYGTASQGYGTVFLLSPPNSGHTAWTEATLWTFSGSDGDSPSSPLVLTPSGTLIGTTAKGGAAGLGTMFEVTP